VTVIVVGTDDGLFELDGPTPRQILAGREVSVVASHGPDMFAVADGDTIVAGIPGKGWRELAEVPDGLVAHCLLSSTAGGPEGLLVGTSEARLLRFDPVDRTFEPVPSFDAIPTRDEWTTPWGGPPDTRSLAAGPAGTFVNVHVGGVWRRIHERNASWQEVVAVADDAHQVVTAGTRVAVAAAVGCGTSDDGGRRWNWSTEGLHASYCRAVAFAGDTVLVTASTGPFTNEAALYRRPAGASTFERCREGLPEWFEHNIDTYCLAADDVHVVAFGTPDGTVYRSFDAGLHWTRVASGLPAIRAVALPV